MRTSDFTMSVVTRHPILPDSSGEEVTEHTRTLIWQLLGGFLFPDTSGTKIRLNFLEVLQGDLALARRWSWGSAVLGYLYHNLCNDAKWETKQVGGCMHLLQIWAWWRISMVRPSVLQVIQHDHLPYGCKYVGNYILIIENALYDVTFFNFISVINKCRWIIPKSYKGSPRHCICLYRAGMT
ncbi:unnamed protein product [Cuscuta epithymum]|uniref:Aminotransferase-like plant mobile domain-containing protein n=1 Tax=Cuscuta epithymum TaxID=186058 RepID=A0AAV0GHP8_9ASTE|nr:unnamed protein product [Cuscuta epithymum]